MLFIGKLFLGQLNNSLENDGNRLDSFTPGPFCAGELLLLNMYTVANHVLAASLTSIR